MRQDISGGPQTPCSTSWACGLRNLASLTLQVLDRPSSFPQMTGVSGYQVPSGLLNRAEQIVGRTWKWHYWRLDLYFNTVKLPLSIPAKLAHQMRTAFRCAVSHSNAMFTYTERPIEKPSLVTLRSTPHPTKHRHVAAQC